MIARRNTRSNPGDGLGMFAPSPVAQILQSESMDTSGWVNPSGGPAVAPQPPPPGLPAVNLPDLGQLASQSESFFKSFAGRSLSSPDAPVYQPSPPWINPPDGFISFLPMSAIVTPVAPSVDTPIISFRVPTGYDGILNKIANYFSGAGAFNNPGAIVFRVLINNIPARNFDSIPLFYGTFSSNGGVLPLGFEGIQIRSGDLVALVVNNVSMPAPGTNCFGLLGGYFYPKETS